MPEPSASTQAEPFHCFTKSWGIGNALAAPTFSVQATQGTPPTLAMSIDSARLVVATIGLAPAAVPPGRSHDPPLNRATRV